VSEETLHDEESEEEEEESEEEEDDDDGDAEGTPGSGENVDENEEYWCAGRYEDDDEADGP
jgi:hypothetical protein